MDLIYKYPEVTAALALVGAYAIYKMYTDKSAEAKGALRLNGLHMNGVHLNGIHKNGVHLNGVHKAGMRLNGSHYGALALNGLNR
jgi:hypothetical protein